MGVGAEFDFGEFGFGFGGGGPDAGIAGSEVHELGLAIAGGDFFVGTGQFIFPVGMHDAGLGVVGELELEVFAEEPVAQDAILDGEDDLDSAEEVAGHPIGAADEDFGLAGVFEVEDAAMFEEAADDATDFDGGAEVRDTGAEAADAADDELDGDAGLGSAVEGGDDLGIDEGVHLGDDARGQALLGVPGFAFDEVEHPLVELEGGDDEFAGFLKLADAGEEVEEAGGVFAEVLSAGEEAEVGIDSCGGGVVVAGAEVEVAADAVGVAPDDERDLGVDFIADEAIDHVDAVILQFAGPFDVIGFIEAGAEFDYGGDLFAVFCGSHEGTDDAGIAAGAVERLFDGEDFGVDGGTLEEFDDRIEAFVGMV